MFISIINNIQLSLILINNNECDDPKVPNVEIDNYETWDVCI